MKLISIIRWILVMLVNALGFITAPLVFPLAYVFRNAPILSKVFWIYYDDEDGFNGTKWWREAKNLKPNTFKTAYLWCAIRNPAWNLQASLKPKDGVVSIVSYNGRLTKNNEPVGIYEFAVLKYVDVKGNYADNKGEFLSIKYSILGSAFVWYKIKNTLYWRKSFAGKIGKFWVELHIGTTNKRYTFRFKVKRNLKIYQA